MRPIGGSPSCHGVGRDRPAPGCGRRARTRQCCVDRLAGLRPGARISSRSCWPSTTGCRRRPAPGRPCASPAALGRAARHHLADHRPGPAAPGCRSCGTAARRRLRASSWLKRQQHLARGAALRCRRIRSRTSRPSSAPRVSSQRRSSNERTGCSASPSKPARCDASRRRAGPPARPRSRRPGWPGPAAAPARRTS